jgi:hypothetical protein
MSDESVEPVGLGGPSPPQGLAVGVTEEELEEGDGVEELPQGLSEVGAFILSILLFISATASLIGGNDLV